jgi:hypothetical protein
MSHAQNWSMQIDGAAARDAGAEGTGVPDIQSSLYRGQGECFAKLYSSAWLQAMAVYYGVAVVLHYVIPALANPHRVQHGEVQPSSETRRDAVRALVPVGLPARFDGLVSRSHDDTRALPLPVRFSVCHVPSPAVSTGYWLLTTKR